MASQYAGVRGDPHLGGERERRPSHGDQGGPRIAGQVLGASVHEVRASLGVVEQPQLGPRAHPRRQAGGGGRLDVVEQSSRGGIGYGLGRLCRLWDGSFMQVMGWGIRSPVPPR